MDDDGRLTAEPPFWAFTSQMECWSCGTLQPVVALVCANVIDGLDDGPAYLKYVQELPDTLLEELRVVHSRLEFRETKTAGLTYLTNVCECGVVIGDWYLHQPGEAFFPTISEDEERIEIHLLDFSEAISIHAGASWGSADRLLSSRITLKE